MHTHIHLNIKRPSCRLHRRHGLGFGSLVCKTPAALAVSRMLDASSMDFIWMLSDWMTVLDSQYSQRANVADCVYRELKNTLNKKLPKDLE